MDGKKNFDEAIKEYFNNTTEKINFKPGMLQRIEEGIENGKGRDEAVFKNNLDKGRLFFQLNLKKAVLTGLCFLIMMSGSVFAFSENARVWAKESLDKMTSFIYTIVYTKDGYKAVQTPKEKSPMNQKITEHNTILPDSELSKVVGFKVRLPYHPEGGYNLYQKSWTEFERDKSILVYASYIKGEMGAYDSEFYSFAQCDQNNIYIKDLYNLKPVKIGEVDGYWAESPGFIYPVNSHDNMPMDIKLSHFLLWIKDGIYNIVDGLDSQTGTQYTQDKFIDFAKALINAGETDYEIPQCYVNYGTWTPFMYSDEDEANKMMQDRVDFQYKIPARLANGNDMKEKGFIYKLSENFQNQFSEEIWNLIGATYGDETDKALINLVISDRDSIVSDWASAEKVSVGSIEAYWGKQTGRDFTRTLDYALYKTSKVNTDSHFLAWKDSGVYYKIYMEKGDFSSREDAIKYAESIINNNAPENK